MQSAHPALADRTTELRIFGALYIIIGLLGVSALIWAAEPFSRLHLLINLIDLVALIVLGVGSLLVTRWARALLLCGGGIALCFNLAGTLRAFLMVHPRFPDSTGFLRLYGAEAVALLVPLATVSFYWREDVAATCARRDRPRWTDRVPLPVLSCCILAAQFALQRLTSPLNSPNALPAAAGVLAIVAAVGLYRLKLWAWAGFFVLYVAWQVAVRIEGSPPWYSWIWDPLIVLAYFLYARRYFVKGRPPAAAA